MRCGRIQRLTVAVFTVIGLLAAVSEELQAQKIRPTVWAGRFYPADATELTHQIDTLLNRAAAAACSQPPPGRLRAVVMPHAGYAFSGPTAAHAVRLMSGCRFAKVVVLGPDHRVGLSNAAVSAAEAWQTPLGAIQVHEDARHLTRSDLFRPVEASDRQEHSIEVLLPFLQHALKDLQIVPIVMGPGDISRMTRQIAAIIDDDTLFVVSSDLSHGLPEPEARACDWQTINNLLALDGSAVLARENSACGKIPLAVLIAIARERHWRPVLLHYSNSGDVAQGSADWVVGYAAVAFYGDDQMNGDSSAPDDQISDAQGQVLVRLARQTITEHLGEPFEANDGYKQALADPDFQRRSGTFVTLKIDGQLRGCIGSLAANETILEGIRRNALNAAFNDYRFTPLTAEELKRVHIEVSLLTPPAPLDYKDADDLIERLRPGVDGVILRRGGRSATFLPQVWDQLPAKEDFLAHLCLKAGLKADAWRSADVAVDTYQVIYFEEAH